MIKPVKNLNKPFKYRYRVKRMRSRYLHAGRVSSRLLKASLFFKTFPKTRRLVSNKVNKNSSIFFSQFASRLSNPSYYFFRSRSSRFFFRYHKAKRLRDTSKKKFKTNLKFFPNIGIFSRFSAYRYKLFFKRRFLFNFYKYNFRSRSDHLYKTYAKSFNSTKFHIHIFQTKNNLFFSTKSSGGRLLFTYTNGQTFYKGSRRTTSAASELAGKQLSKLLYSNKIKIVYLIFRTPLTAILKAAVKGLSIRLSFSGMRALYFSSHNGMRIRSTRRI